MPVSKNPIADADGAPSPEDITEGRSILGDRLEGAADDILAAGARPRPLPSFVTAEEEAAHLAFLKETIKDFSLWAGYGVTVETEAEEAA